MEKKVGLQFVMQLKKIFEEKNWSNYESNDYVFESLCNLSELLIESEEEYELFLDLIKRYSWLSLNDYGVKVKKLLELILTKPDIPINKFYTFPIIKPEDQKKNKSGNTVSYMFKGIKPFIKEAKHIKFEELTLFEELIDLNLKRDDYLVLVDDYIGSGQTLFACIDEIIRINPELGEKIIISTIAIQYDTIPKINSPLFYIDQVQRGISDCYTSPDREKHIKTMINLETKLISGRNFSLGYEQSEGLITMFRTPDNTFPIFWHEYKKSTKLYPPFPRE
ncbi:hypothetical protein [Chryseobacterium sp. HMWF035]|uniref:phosphoribosyltransferase-like protein n=1 Tax=Chryseobacterium sp. HMWF035 TaxID=2056868 RepID=UPI000D56F829|nr:hypothetical protein [Chryseobacterium sp. HMWF035]PVV55982.1 hypothetical protein DD829_12380 [Chryseobacterium sp. HMWF035]